MQNFEIEKEDSRKIRLMFGEILSKGAAVTYDAFLVGKKNYEKNFVNADLSTFPERQKRDRFSFFSKVEAGFSLHTIFRDIYAAKYIAKQVYIRDEDERFDVEIDAQVPLGVVEGADGKISITSVCRAILKVRNPEVRNPNFGMPFDIIDLQLIPAED